MGRANGSGCGGTRYDGRRHHTGTGYDGGARGDAGLAEGLSRL
jgi:hypothetical protein